MGERYSKLEKVARWLVYGVILSCAPFLLAAGYEWYIGYDFDLLKVEYVPGFVTITFSVAANVCGYATDIEREFKQTAKRIFAILSAGSLCLCLLFYSWLLSSERSMPPDKVVENVEAVYINKAETESGVETFVIDDLGSDELATKIRADRATVIAKIVLVILLVNVAFGSVLEYFSSDTMASNDSHESDKLASSGEPKT